MALKSLNNKIGKTWCIIPFTNHMVMFFTYIGMGVHVSGDMQFHLVGEIFEQPIRIDEDFLNNVICNLRYILHPKDISEEEHLNPSKYSK